MYKNKGVRVSAYVIILLILTTFVSLQTDVNLHHVSFATTTSDLLSYQDVLQEYDDAVTVYDAYEVIDEASFKNFTDDNVYDLLSISYGKETWQEPNQGRTIDQVQILIATKGKWMNRFTDKGVKVKKAIHKSYYLAYKWPDNEGFIEGTEHMLMLEENALIDRYGYPGGSFLSPAGVPYKERALTPGTKETRPYFTYKVIKTFEVEAGNIQPWFGVGTGTSLQYYLGDKNVQYYLDTGYLEIVPNKLPKS